MSMVNFIMCPKCYIRQLDPFSIVLNGRVLPIYVNLFLREPLAVGDGEEHADPKLFVGHNRNMKQRMTKALKISGIFISGLLIGAILMNFLYMYVLPVYRDTIRINHAYPVASQSLPC
jgi:hypothetical protein